MIRFRFDTVKTREMRGVFVAVLAILGMSSTPTWSQPQAPLTGANAACASGPILAGGQPDTLSGTDAVPDDSGFVRLFNGKNLKGWWEGCGSTHSAADTVYGGIWLVDSVNGLLFANQNSNGAGSVLMTNKSYGNYELIFDLWPSFGNDAGVFNRVTASGSCYQTGIDYIANSSVGGVYFEGGYTGTSRNYDPYVFGANKATITIGTNSNVNNRLDTITKRFADPTMFGCPVTGCGPANWTAIWDTGGWNQMRVRFFGGGTSASDKVHNYADIRRLGSTKWIPTIRDSVQYATPANPIGLQIHGGTSSWGNPNGNWYRNIRIRPLDASGNPVPVPVLAMARTVSPRLMWRHGSLSGNIPEPHRLTVLNAKGSVIGRFVGDGKAPAEYALGRVTGLLLLELRTARGVERFRLFAL